MRRYSMEIKEIEFRDFFEVAGDLFERHQQEVPDTPDTNNWILDIDYSLYVQLERVGGLFVLAAFEEDQAKPIGYIVCFMTPSLHSKGKLICDTDVIYIDPQYRGQGLAEELLLTAEDVAQSKGANVFMVSMKHYARFDELLDKLDYEDHEIRKIKVF